MPSNSFSIYKNNIYKCDSSGNGSYDISTVDLVIPAGAIPGAPATLRDLAIKVGAANLSITYYAMATGSVSSHGCWCTYSLYVQGNLSDGSKTNYTNVWSTSGSPDQGGGVNSGWIVLLTNANSVINKIWSQEGSSGSGCGCAFESLGGWSDVSISLRIDVIVNLLDFCLGPGPNYMYKFNDMCYYYISDYITDKKLGPSQAITTALQNYCSQKYPNKGLSIFNLPATINKQDYQVCACNMPDIYYQEFEQSIKSQFPNLDLGSIRPNCLLPACINSPFKNNELDGCPIPQCLEIVNINDSNIVGPTTINQDQNCNKYGIPHAPGVPPSPVIPPSFRSISILSIVGVVIFLLLVLTLIAVLFVPNKKKE